MDGDGYLDLILHFVAADVASSATSHQGVLTGQTQDGRVIVGVDPIQVRPAAEQQ